MKLNIKGYFRNAIYAPYDRTKPLRSILNKIIRIYYFSVKSFISNECNLKSALLTFYTLISMVPLLAIIFSIAKGFGFEEFLQKQLLETFKEQQDVISFATRFAYAFISQIESETIIGVGFLFLFFTVFGLFGTIENTLNTIWNVKKYRGLLRRTINYVITLIVFPIFFIATTGITLFINAEVSVRAQQYEFLKYFSEYVLPVLKYAPYVVMCLLFSFIYIYTPNSKIYYKSRIFAGILAGAFFQFWQIIYIDFQVDISSYSIVYGSFAALPLFLIWMQVNFLIFLFGAEIAAQTENDRFFKTVSINDRFTMITQKQLALIVLHEITSNFLKGEGAHSIDQISKQLGISLLDARQALHTLEKANIIAEISVTSRSIELYQLIVNPELFTIHEVSDLIDQHLLRQARSKETTTLLIVSNCFEKFEKSIKESGVNLNLKDFANLKPV